MVEENLTENDLMENRSGVVRRKKPCCLAPLPPRPARPAQAQQPTRHVGDLGGRDATLSSGGRSPIPGEPSGPGPNRRLAFGLGVAAGGRRLRSTAGVRTRLRRVHVVALRGVQRCLPVQRFSASRICLQALEPDTCRQPGYVHVVAARQLVRPLHDACAHSRRVARAVSCAIPGAVVRIGPSVCCRCVLSRLNQVPLGDSQASSRRSQVLGRVVKCGGRLP